MGPNETVEIPDWQVKELVPPLELFRNSQRDTGGSRYYLDRCYDALTKANETFSGAACRSVLDEVQMAMTHVELCLNDRRHNPMSPTYFYDHMGRAIALALGLS
jgi:hypothetical protein